MNAAHRYRLPAITQLSESTIEDLGLVDDNAENILNTLAATRAEMLNLWNPYQRALNRLVKLQQGASLGTATLKSLAMFWTTKPAEFKDYSVKTERLLNETANRISVWLMLSKEIKNFDPVKNEKELAPLQAYLKNGKQIVDYMRMEEAKKIVSWTDVVVTALAGPVGFLLKRILQIAYAKLVRPVRQTVVVVSQGAKATGQAVYAGGKYVVTRTGETIGGALKILEFVTKYGIYIVAGGAILYFAGPMIAATAGRSLGGYAGGKRKSMTRELARE